jgi:hypothetical protein
MTNEAYPGSSYPAMPGEPVRDLAPLGPPPPPVANAVKLMLLRAALNLLELPLLFATKDSLRDQIRKANPAGSQSTLDRALTASLVAATVVGLVFIVLYVLLALQVRKGKNWARIVTLVIAGLGVLSGLAAFVQPAAGLSRALGVVALVIDVAIIVLLAQRPSSQFFRRAL